MVWRGLDLFDGWSLFRLQALGFVITVISRRSRWSLAAGGQYQLQCRCAATPRVRHSEVASCPPTKQTGTSKWSINERNASLLTRCCYALNKLDAQFVQRDLHSLETLEPLVAPSLHSGHYSLGPLGF